MQSTKGGTSNTNSQAADQTDNIQEAIIANQHRNAAVSEVAKVVAIVPIAIALVVVICYIVSNVRQAKANRRTDVSRGVEDEIIRKNS